ncbi:MAG: D-amino acid aminotransferase [Ruminococcaceae bacterium]|nr:D-amino acid aminotransferase [Oscillospiraceae bacterium]
MKNLGYYNGTYAPLDELTVPFNDRVHFFGDGVYEATLARNYTIYALDAHVDRFFSSASMVDIHIPHGKQEIKDILSSLVKKLDDPDQLVYWQVTRGTQERSHTYPEDMIGNFWVVLRPMKMKDLTCPITAITAPDTRFLHCNIKTLNLMPAVLYAQQAQRSGHYETILYREGGRVTECSHSNVHIITRDGTFKTAPTDHLILPGIARAHLIKACCELGIPVDESPFSLEEMMDADEVLVSSSTSPIRFCSTIDGKPVGGRAPETVKKLMDWTLNDFYTKTNL